MSWWLGALGFSGSAWLLLGCTEGPCAVDGDCKGERVCDQGVCADPGSGGSGQGGNGQGANNTGPGVGAGGPTGSTCVQVNGKTVCVQSSAPSSGPPPSGVTSVPPPDNLPSSASVPLGGFQVPDQGGCGSCAAFATRNAMSIRGVLQTGAFVDFSPAHIWHVAGYGSDDCQQGSSIQSVFNAQVNTGDHIVPMFVWPYSSSSPISSLDAVPPANELEEGGVAHIDSAYSIDQNDITDLKAAIAQGWPPVVGVWVYNLGKWASGNGDIDVPAPGDNPDGGHAVTLVSYDDATSRFGFVNSWGADWGSDGFGTMTYQFLQQYMMGGMTATHLSYKATASCNDGKIDPGETCDGNDFGGATCKTLGFSAGSLACDACQISTAGCCKDACSPGDTQCFGQSQQTCEKAPGQCAAWGQAQTCQYGCSNGACVSQSCGDGVKNASEQCDGNDLGGQTCQSQGLDGGTLKCNSGSCTFNTSQCCTDQCDYAGQSTCSGSQEKTCQQSGACLGWSAAVSCPYGCDVDGTCKDGCTTSYSVDWVCDTYHQASCVGQDIFDICMTAQASGQVTVKAKKCDGSNFGVRPYHLEVSQPNDGSCGPSNWSFADVSAAAQGVGGPVLTFNFTPPWQENQTVKAYCLVASTKSSDPGYDPNSNQQKSWWYGPKVAITKNCQ